MIDEMDELRRSNQVSAEALVNAVAMDRQELIDALEADSGGRQPRLRLLGGHSGRSANRVGYVGAMVAAAAAFIGVVLISGEDPPSDLDAVEVADDTTEQGPTTAAPTDSSSTVPELTVTVDGEPDGSVSAPKQETPSVTQPAPTTQATADAESPPPSPAPVPASDGPFDRSVDLLALHYDHAHLDDGHATVAALEIATSFGLQPHVVAGTYANGYDGYVHPFEPIMQAAWGDGWVNAHLDRPGARTSSIERWLATLDAGGRVWVAEGGVSDFTADVVREIQRQRPNLDTRIAIHVVQHNNRNESESAAENVAFLKANVAYERIDDGNAANGTADLNMGSDEFEAAALAGRHGGSWSAAFEYLSAGELDFSDTVEVLHILGVGTNEVADPTDFAARFMN